VMSSVMSSAAKFKEPAIGTKRMVYRQNEPNLATIYIRFTY
jgi:hypothetical protein